VRVWWSILGVIALLYIAIAGLIALPKRHAVDNQQATGPRHTEVTPPSTREMAPATGPAYNYRHMAMGGAIVAAMAATVFWVVRRQGRSPAPTARP
jgi:hypothetical protein